MVEHEQSIELNEKSGIQFSLSFLIQILATVILAVWGYSQLDARISHGEHLGKMHTVRSCTKHNFGFSWERVN